VVNVPSILKNRHADPGGNKPYTGSDSFFDFYMLYEKPRKTLLFSSREKYTQKSLCFPKYGRFTPLLTTANAL
jgi:hypothetical protein